MAEIRQAAAGNDTTQQPFLVNFAGDTFNTALYCARLLAQPEAVGYFSYVGTDPLSDGLIEMARSEDLSVDYLTQNAHHNIGVYSVTTDNRGERSFHYWRYQSAARQLF